LRAEESTPQYFLHLYYP